MNYETPSESGVLEKHKPKELPTQIVEYGFHTVSMLLGRFKNAPEDLERILNDPKMFFDFLAEADHGYGQEHPDEQRTTQERLRLTDTALRESSITGQGTSNLFRILDEEHAINLPKRLIGRIGLREMRQVPILDTISGMRYLGIPVNHDQPAPVEAFRKGAMIQAVGGAVKGIFPEIYHYTEERGAKDIETNRPIPGLENEIIAMRAIMEVLNGPSIAQIVDCDGIFWKRRYSARKPEEIMDFLRSNEYREYIRYSVERSAERWPGLLDIDWDHLGDVFESKMRFMNSLCGGVSMLHRDLHFGNSALLFKDREGHTPDSRLIGMMDFDLSAFSTVQDFGDHLGDYLNEGKSTSLGEQHFMPDHLSGDRTPLKKIIRMDASAHHRLMFSIIGDIVRDIRKMKSTNRMRMRA